MTDAPDDMAAIKADPMPSDIPLPASPGPRRQAEPPNIHRCPRCSNFMNWQRVWGGDRCLQCGQFVPFPVPSLPSEDSADARP